MSRKPRGRGHFNSITHGGDASKSNIKKPLKLCMNEIVFNQSIGFYLTWKS